MTDNYITLLPGERRKIEVDYRDFADRPVNLMVKQFGHPERKALSL